MLHVLRLPLSVVRVNRFITFFLILFSSLIFEDIYDNFDAVVAFVKEQLGSPEEA